HVMAAELEARMRAQVLEVGAATGAEVVERDDVQAGAQQPVAQVTAEKACAAGDEHAAGGAEGSVHVVSPGVRPAAVVEASVAGVRGPGQGKSTLNRQAPRKRQNTARYGMASEVTSISSTWDGAREAPRSRRHAKERHRASAIAASAAAASGRPARPAPAAATVATTIAR